MGRTGLETPQEKLARRLALGVPALLLGGALIGEHVFDLYPCEMCWWQRWPHLAAIALALVGAFAPYRRFWIAMAAGGILTSGLIGGFHAGVEYGWWEGITGCATFTPDLSGSLDSLNAAPTTRCDQAAWTLAGISLAGFNFLISCVSAVTIFALLLGGKAKAA
ncbi:disulfide bond formation protein B [Alteriqipengyuania sp. WL0013]|uniref:disulfide bond formation protein B n=1 Tax=Alteriqipengyuania sp. WL0013 TaxID=3110773 RepID=UPI002CF0FAA3|nr:disulfide bond formation protein B [Alteriqipengyuania sp. WL0013]MEB3416289.1 disulfide bond formation protein B [Alteriqipengyuania sp. WL0013]